MRLIEDQDELVARLRELEELAGPGHVRLHGRTESGHALLRKTVGRIDKAPKVPSAKALQKLAEALGIQWTEGLEERVLPYWASDERVDGDGDIIRQVWHFNEFAKNSPLMYSHDWFSPPIGRALQWKVVGRKEDDYKGKALWLLELFATQEQSAFADSVFRLVQAGLLVSGSVGFYATQVSDPDDAEREKLGLGRYGLIFEENHLLEFSTCPIPCNAGAHVARALTGAKGVIKPSDVTVLRESWRSTFTRGPGDAERWVEIERGIVALARALWPQEDFRVHDELDVPMLTTLSFSPEPEDDSEPEIEEVEPAELDPEVAVRLDALEERFEEQISILNDIRSGVERIERSSRSVSSDAGDHEGGETSEALRRAMDDLSKRIGEPVTER